MNETVAITLAEKLAHAIQHDTFSKAEELLELGANPNIILPSGISAFHLAVGTDTLDSLELVQLLLRYDAEPNIRSDDGMTPVHIAATWGYSQALHLLLSHGGNPELLDEDGTNALDMAVENEKWECLNLLTAYMHQKEKGSPKKWRKSTSFFPDINLNTNAGEGNASSKTETSRDFPIPAKQNRMDLEYETILSESIGKVEIGIHHHVVPHSDATDCPSVCEKNEEVGIEGCDNETGNITLTSKKLEEVMNDSCSGIDLTSPDHPTVFNKYPRYGDLQSLDKTIACADKRKSAFKLTETGQVGDETHISEDLKSCEKKSTCPTCQIDDIVLCCRDFKLPSNKELRLQRRAMFYDTNDESSSVLSHQPIENDVHATCSKDVPGLDTYENIVKSLESPPEKTTKLKQETVDISTSDEDSFLTCTSDMTCQQDNTRRQDLDRDDLTRELKEVASYRISHPLSKVLEIDCKDSNIGNDSLEYLYHDQDTGSMLIERQCPSACPANISHDDASGLDYSHVSTMEETVLYDWRNYHSNQDEDGRTKYIPIISEELLQLSNKEIRELIRTYGEEAGPVTATTRMVYLHHLARLQNDPDFAPSVASQQQTSHGFRWELAAYLNTGQMAETDGQMAADERLMVAPFQTPDPTRKWREGTLKSSFNYLLLDPRVTKDLPGRYTQLTQLETFQVFVAAIFYIGKGKRGRPYAHFYEALSAVEQCKEKKASQPKQSKKPRAKINHILDIWNAGLGVVSLHCFQSVIPVEAYTREACMVEAMGLTHLSNVKRGDFYGPSVSLSARKRRQMGVFLLKKACQIFLVEGERQIRPVDIAIGQ